MIWWLRIRAAPAVLGATLLILLVAVLAPRSEVPVPSVVGGLTSGMPLRDLVPLLPVLLMLYGKGRADEQFEKVAARPVAYFDITFALFVIGVTLLAATVVPDGLAVARNVAGYLGFALLVQWCSTARFATALTAFMPFAVGSIGGHGGNPAWWAWPMHEGEEPAAAVAASLLCIGGLTLSTCTPLMGTREPEE
ncbi:hypothetical protein AB0M57_10720 [Streptomyces sp. NPDC051597]|uniref:hypothetical protein n=1 Tax=Streptomyces sp. NPDC051597 TaxID=3155049 RepID=UPI00342ADA08